MAPHDTGHNRPCCPIRLNANVNIMARGLQYPIQQRNSPIPPFCDVSTREEGEVRSMDTTTTTLTVTTVLANANMFATVIGLGLFTIPTLLTLAILGTVYNILN